MQLTVFDDADALADAAAAEFAGIAERAVADRGRCLIALAGGNTPRAAYRQLVSSFGGTRVPWHGIDFFWGDERPVPPDHADSNYRMAHETLLGPLGIPSARVHRMRGEATDLVAAADEYSRQLEAVASVEGGVPALDLVLLGMGSDGHTASLFPETSALSVTDRWAVANRVAALSTTRLTMSFPVLLAARAIRVLVSGVDKAVALRQVFSGPWMPAKLPAQRLREAGSRVLWLADRNAAGQ